MSNYPKHWKDLAKSIKEKSDWRCNRGGRVCLRPGDKSITDKPRAYNLQIHHWDRNPSNNKIENLICLCSACHLSYHRYRRQPISQPKVRSTNHRFLSKTKLLVFCGRSSTWTIQRQTSITHSIKDEPSNPPSTQIVVKRWR